MFDRPSGGRNAVLVALDFGHDNFDESLGELKLLAVSAGLSPVTVVLGKRDRPDSALFAGSGKVEEVKLAVASCHADLVIFNHELSPAQERNLEVTLQCRVVDRVALILDIFAQRAKSHEGKLQVELAQLDHLATRLVRGWSHLERQRGGVGMRGPGETQLETDRRLISKRVKVLKEKLAKLQSQREVQRRSRARGMTTSFSLVGYTNAGKSTLFNALTHAGAYAADKLFATLDTTTRRIWLPAAGNLVISDTVGFIRELPTGLIAAFRATLEETIHADLLLHVVDSSSSVRNAQISEVERVLGEIGAADIPHIFVWNKIDLKSVGRALESGIDRDEYGKISRVRLSAQTGDGVEGLRQALTEAAILKNPMINQQSRVAEA